MMKYLKTLKLVAALALVAGSAHAQSVTEGDTVDFSITLNHLWYIPGVSGTKIRVWYETKDGTATGGEDYEAAHSSSDNVEAEILSAFTISVETYSDDVVEGEETFDIQLKKVDLWVDCTNSWNYFCTHGWNTGPSIDSWSISGSRTATIVDAGSAS